MKVPAAVPGWAAAEWCGCAAVDWAGDATCRCLRVCPVPTVTMVLPVTDIHTPMFHIIMWGLCSCLCCFRQNHFEMIGSKYLLNILLLVFQKTTWSRALPNDLREHSLDYILIARGSTLLATQLYSGGALPESDYYWLREYKVHQSTSIWLRCPDTWSCKQCLMIL